MEEVVYDMDLDFDLLNSRIDNIWEILARKFSVGLTMSDWHFTEGKQPLGFLDIKEIVPNSKCVYILRLLCFLLEF